MVPCCPPDWEGTSCSGMRVHCASLVFKVENSYSISVPIFKQFHKNIIGKGGANIKKVTGQLVPWILALLAPPPQPCAFPAADCKGHT